MIKKLLSITIVQLILLSSLTVLPVSSETPIQIFSGTAFYVGGTGPGNYTCIQDAIDNASDGDNVFVYNGTYYESILINKSINLTGENNEDTVIKSGINNITIDINYDNIVISNFKILSEGTIGQSIRLFKSNNSIICNNQIIGDWIGIYLHFSNNTKILKNNLHNCSISVHDSNKNIISQNDIENNGLTLSDSSNNKISYNKIKSTDTGILISGSCVNNTIKYNIIKDCDFGVNLGFSGSKNSISNNDFISNKYLNAIIFTSKCIWYHNYWSRPKVLPKIIFGHSGTKIFIDFDWHPALIPNCIEE